MRIISVRFEDASTLHLHGADALGVAEFATAEGVLFTVPYSDLRAIAERVGAGSGYENTYNQKQLREFFSNLLGAELDEKGELAEAIRESDERWKALARGRLLCARAEQSRTGLMDKLLARGFSRKASEAAIQHLQREGFVDDLRFAEAWMRSRLRRKASGPAELSARLRARGVGRSDIESALGAIDFSEVLPRAIESELRRLRRGSASPMGREAINSLRRALRAQGFRTDQIDEAIDAMRLSDGSS